MKTEFLNETLVMKSIERCEQWLIIFIGLFLLLGCEIKNEFKIDIENRFIIGAGKKIIFRPLSYRNKSIILEKKDNVNLRDTIYFDSFQKYYKMNSPFYLHRNENYDVENFYASGYMPNDLTIHIDSIGKIFIIDSLK